MLERRRYVAVMWAAARSSCRFTGLARPKLSRNGSGTCCCIVLLHPGDAALQHVGGLVVVAGEPERAPRLRASARPGTGRTATRRRRSPAPRGVRLGVGGESGIGREARRPNVAGERGAGQVEPLAVGNDAARGGERGGRLERSAHGRARSRAQRAAPPPARARGATRRRTARRAPLAERELQPARASAATSRASSPAAPPSLAPRRARAARARAGRDGSSRRRRGSASAPRTRPVSAACAGSSQRSASS